MLSPNRSVVKAVNPSKIPSGRLLSRLPYRFRVVSPVSPERSPDFRAVIPLERRLRLVIAARCASVTSEAEVTPAAAMIASRTRSVRSLTGGISA